MEKVEGLMRSLKLSEAENRGLKIGSSDGSKVGIVDLQSMGKLFSEKTPYVDGIIKTLGSIWCPIKGIKCKEMGNNMFLLSFLQQSGKRKALEEGPWMFNNELFAVQDFDPAKSLEDYVFNDMSIWVRVLKLPLGAMNRSTGEKIGDVMGEFVEVDVGEDDIAMGEFLRVRVRLDLSKPLMIGITLQFDEKMLPKWYPFEYEFLPDFCFTCGIVGHTDKGCSTRLARGRSNNLVIG